MLPLPDDVIIHILTFIKIEHLIKYNIIPYNFRTILVNSVKLTCIKYFNENITINTYTNLKITIPLQLNDTFIDTLIENVYFNSNNTRPYYYWLKNIYMNSSNSLRNFSSIILPG